VSDRARRRVSIIGSGLLRLRGNQTGPRSSSIIPCTLAREAISALADGEDPPVAEDIAVAHIAKCGECATFRANVVSLTRQMRVRVHTPAPSREAKILAMLGCNDAAPPIYESRWRRWGDRRRLSWVRAAQWAAGLVPLGVAVPALAIGVFAHVHIVPSHVLTPCTVALVHHAGRR
jgi:predicted anti-sigma-YlaC factor YlaD